MFAELIAVFSREPILMAPLGVIAFFLIRSAFAAGPMKRRILSGEYPNARLQAYAETMRSLWVIAGVCLAAWLISGRSLAEIGFRIEGGAVALAGWAIAAAGAGYMIFSIVQAALSRKTRISLREQFANAGDFDLYRPENEREHVRFQWLGFTAGVTEEIIFRGFLIGVLSLALPVWIAAIASVAIFTVGYAYQGLSGMIRVAFVSIVLTAIFLLSGSLWPAIALHYFIDAAAGALILLIQENESDDAAEVQPA
jgi:membrane protease YdiL (CAAX protease family)